MSIVIRESHATNDQPLFVGVNGAGTIDGSLSVSGLIRAGTSGSGDVQTSSAFTCYNPSTLATRSRITANDTGDLFVQSGGFVKFTEIGTGNANTTLQISAYPTNADVMTVGGNLYVADTIFGIGPAPTSTTLDAATKPVSIGTPAQFTVSSPLFPLVAGAEYDVQCSGYWTVGAGNTITPQDYAEVFLAVGSGTAPGYLNFTATDYQFPNFSEDPWTANSFRPFKIRARMISNGIPAMVLEAAVYTPGGTGAYPALQATITTLDIVRVK